MKTESASTVRRQSFEYSAIPDFQPWTWARGPHAQTILPYWLTRRVPYVARQHDVVLDDGDIIVLHDDCPTDWNGERTVMLVHGLGGCHGSSYMMRTADLFSRHGLRVFRMDMRGCGAGLLKARGVFHADRSADLLAAIKYVGKLASCPLTICGFSLGANLTLKMLGKFADQIPEWCDSALVVEPPIDLGYCCHKLSHGAGKMYDRFFAKLLWRDFSQRRTKIDRAEHVKINRAPPTLLAFDRAVTAPLAGYNTADEYYRSASAADALPHIQIPTAILAAHDDPIVPVEIYDDAPMSSRVQLFVTPGGGHLGFYSNRSPTAPNRRWMDHCLLRWIQQRSVVVESKSLA